MRQFDGGPATLKVGGATLELSVRGTGQPLVFLHPGNGLLGADALLDRLSTRHMVVAPLLPGFGTSELPKHITNVDDLAYVTLDLLDALDLTNVVVVGSDFGGWIAAEVAVRSTARIARLVLMGAVGIKNGGREDRDIADVFGLSTAELDRRTYYDADRFGPKPAELREDDLRSFARNREALAFFGWRPYMYNPKLRNWLHRINVPTLCLWGAADRITAPEYGQSYAARIPNSTFEVIDAAGHFPHVEQPDATAGRILAFASDASRQMDPGNLKAEAA
ncbi:alpha/beta fold hydrolase [Roseomonas chloroacetimidivorans]|uniref:alpha/beta fold hydrolase n=1 Tax=Roseomonas chloroacetimidivorans TaxID=1766656 RepID=UPI003C768731